MTGSVVPSEGALRGELWREVWMVRLHPHDLQNGQNPVSTSPRFAVLLRLWSLPSSAGSPQIWELLFLCGNVFSSSQDLPSVFRDSGQSSWSQWAHTASCSLCDWCAQPAAGTDPAGQGREVAVEVAVAWKLLSGPVPGSVRVLFSLHRLHFLLCCSYVLVNTGRIIFFVI